MKLAYLATLSSRMRSYLANYDAPHKFYAGLFICSSLIADSGGFQNLNLKNFENSFLCDFLRDIFTWCFEQISNRGE